MRSSWGQTTFGIFLHVNDNRGAVQWKCDLMVASRCSWMVWRVNWEAGGLRPLLSEAWLHVLHHRVPKGARHKGFVVTLSMHMLCVWTHSLWLLFAVCRPAVDARSHCFPLPFQAKLKLKQRERWANDLAQQAACVEMSPLWCHQRSQYHLQG